MSQPLTVNLSDAAFAALALRAKLVARSPAELAASALEQYLGNPEASRRPLSEAERQAAHARFEHHFGAINLGHATGADNETIDADLARAYAETHEDG